ncbi:MAG: permease [Chloroflexi bacterium]|nr:permease [Chloroflexota bacterium]
MDQTTLIINRVLPIFLLIGLGYWIRRSRFLTENTVEDLRKIVVNLAMPSVLFISFLQIELQTAYLVVFVMIFVLCVGLYGLGHLLKGWLRIEHPYFPFLMTGFEYGMLGVSLFGGAYGLEQIGYIAVVDLGHELFIWFVFLALLLMKRDGLQNPGQLVRTFFTSPVIIAVISGIVLNLLGAQAFLDEAPVAGALMSTVRFLSSLTIPLILIIVGYGIKFDRQGMRETLLVAGVRLALLIPLALILNAVVIRGLLKLESPFEAALFTLLVLPPPFIVPLYMKAGMPEERQYVNNTLMVHTVFSLAVFTLYFISNPVL